MTPSGKPTQGFVKVEGGELYYEVASTGPVLVFIHAGIADCTMWDDQFAVFAQHYRVIRYDTRGFGKSKTDSVSFSNRQDLADLLKHLGVTRAAVIGLSRGGTIAVDFTLEHPEIVEALVVVGAGVGGYEYQPTSDDGVETKLFAAMENAEQEKDYARVVELDLQVWVDGPRQPPGRTPAAVRERVRAMDASNYTRKDGDAKPQPLQPPAVGRLGEIRVPTLVIVGDFDTMDTQASADLLAHGIPGSTKVAFHGVAHMVNMEQPEKFNQTVLDFLAANNR